MSQPLDFGTNKDPLDIPIKNISSLREIFTAAEKKPSKFMIGLEYELFAVTDNKLTALQFEGEKSIVSYFTYMITKSKDSDDPFEPIYDEENLVALKSKKTVIALEPGGQIEIALGARIKLEDAINDLKSTVNFLDQCAKELGIQLLSIGFHPRNTNIQMAKVKKSRYKIMREYMKKKGSMGQDMMHRTASIQLNLDYLDEKDMAKKMKVSAILSPMLSVLCASSAYYENKANELQVFRLKVWQNTDNDRSKMPKVVFDKDFSYTSWINFALDVPMYFIRRDGKYIDFTGRSFKDFLKNGMDGYTATMRDFVDHLSTIFTEVRLKPCIELRSMDSLPQVYVIALMTLVFGIIYDEKNLDHLAKKFEKVDFAMADKLFEDIIVNGGDALILGQSVWEIVDEILLMTQKSLKNEAHYLDPFMIISKKRSSPAHYMQSCLTTITDEKAHIVLDKLGVLAGPLEKDI